MARIAKEHTDRLQELKSSVEESHEYFSKNNLRYNEYMKFVFYESMTEVDKQVLDDLGKPTLEFNILESFISRLRGEFSKQQPSLTVRAADGIPVNMLTSDFTKLIEVIEAHLRAVFFDAGNDMLAYNIYSDLLAGGFSVMEVYTNYVNEKSFEQNIIADRVFDPTMTGFDPMARASHKGDGRYCFQIYPRTRDQFESEYGKEAAERMKYSKNVQGFGWSYRGEKDEIILVCDYYEKQYKKTKIYKLTNGVTVTKKEYDNALQVWNDEGRIEQFPEILDERTTDLEEIVRYRFCENELLDHTRTNYKHLPLIFVDGNSVMISNGQVQQQVTRPYVYHAKGIQRLKNFAGQTLANELENLVQHKFIVPIESIPEDYLEAYQNVQKADTLVYNHFLDKNSPEVTLPPPREIQRTPIPPEVTNTFRLSDDMTQTILGTYDAALGINSNQLSGKAIQSGAMQSNSAAMPYIVGYIKGLNRVAQIIVDLIPKFYRTPRSLPVLKPNGQRSYEIVNKRGSLYMNYDPNSLQVKVETGVNFSMQKEVALRTVTEMMQASPVFGDFINTKGLAFLLDNIEIRGIEQLKLKAEEYEKENDQKRQEQQQMQMQQMQQQTELQMAGGRASVTLTQAEAMKAQAEAQKEMKEAQGPSKNDIDMLKVQLDAQKNAADEAIKKQDADTKFLDVVSKVRNDAIDSQLEMARLDAENARTQMDALEAVTKLKSEE